MKKQLLCFIDVETTGVDHAINGLTQIAGQLAYLEGKVVTPFEAFDYDVQPFDGAIIEDGALSVTGKTRELIAAYPTERQVYNALTTLLETHCDKYDRNSKFWFVGYNAQFDYGFLRKFFERQGDKYFGSWFWNPPIDVMQIAAFGHFLTTRHTLPNFKLGTIAESLEVKVEGDLHNASIDIALTRLIFEKILSGGTL